MALLVARRAAAAARPVVWGPGRHPFAGWRALAAAAGASEDTSECPFRAALAGGQCYKLFETPEAVALLNTHPQAPRGSVVVLPRQSGGFASIFEMPDEEAAVFVQHVPRAAKMVQEALEAESVCCLPQAEGEYPHVHVLPGRSQGGEATELGVPSVAFDSTGTQWEALAAEIRARDGGPDSP
eukprot:CAMPEP_0203879552 /NCGR_PEP_ID=MMETSP0359-20131031/24004_1 /ASSEMBLY_ACC=CAM_ASM_000338 /TAXON_ID=268821 /ORGANISM="Scrippsiella Hangoei, Strain SHTV-5" /LENGTH=182 /DNA_ID=CAMNT_0050798997 /DNA_START=15 /DNA_END=566 /DNA_ORIENTATION=-